MLSSAHRQGNRGIAGCSDRIRTWACTPRSWVQSICRVCAKALRPEGPWASQGRPESPPDPQAQVLFLTSQRALGCPEPRACPVLYVDMCPSPGTTWQKAGQGAVISGRCRVTWTFGAVLWGPEARGGLVILAVGSGPPPVPVLSWVTLAVNVAQTSVTAWPRPPGVSCCPGINPTSLQSQSERPPRADGAPWSRGSWGPRVDWLACTGGS